MIDVCFHVASETFKAGCPLKGALRLLWNAALTEVYDSIDLRIEVKLHKNYCIVLDALDEKASSLSSRIFATSADTGNRSGNESLLQASGLKTSVELSYEKGTNMSC